MFSLVASFTTGTILGFINTKVHITDNKNISKYLPHCGFASITTGLLVQYGLDNMNKTHCKSGNCPCPFYSKLCMMGGLLVGAISAPIYNSVTQKKSVTPQSDKTKYFGESTDEEETTYESLVPNKRYTKHNDYSNSNSYSDSDSDNDNMYPTLSTTPLSTTPLSTTPLSTTPLSTTHLTTSFTDKLYSTISFIERLQPIQVGYLILSSVSVFYVIKLTNKYLTKYLNIYAYSVLKENPYYNRRDNLIDIISKQ
jgi:hypothetical protein